MDLFKVVDPVCTYSGCKNFCYGRRNLAKSWRIILNHLRPPNGCITNFISLQSSVRTKTEEESWAVRRRPPVNLYRSKTRKQKWSRAKGTLS